MFLFTSCDSKGESKETKLNGPYGCLISDITVSSTDDSWNVYSFAFDRIIYNDEDVNKIKIGDRIAVDIPNAEGYYGKDIVIEDIRSWGSSNDQNLLYTINDKGITFDQLGNNEYDRLLKTDEGWVLSRHYSNGASIPYWKYIESVEIIFDDKTAVFTTMASEDPMAQTQISYKEIAEIEGPFFGMAHLTDNHVDYIVLILDWQHFY